MSDTINLVILFAIIHGTWMAVWKRAGGYVAFLTAFLYFSGFVLGVLSVHFPPFDWSFWLAGAVVGLPVSAVICHMTMSVPQTTLSAIKDD